MQYLTPRHEGEEHGHSGNSSEAGDHHNHAHTHYINVKYGYLILFFTIVFVLARLSLMKAYYNRWRSSGRSKTGLKLVQFISLPAGLILTFLLLNIIGVWGHIPKSSVIFKRWGRISYALLPLDILLSIRPSPFKIDNYLDNLRIHKWLSRIILFFGIIHSIAFFILWLTKKTLQKLLQTYVLFGIVVFTSFVTLSVVNWRPFRNLSYDLFYIAHNIAVFGFVILLNFHAKPDVSVLSAISIILLIYQFVIKIPSGSKVIQLKTIISNERSDLQIIKINKNEIIQSFNNKVIDFNQEILPGCHLRLGYSKKSFKFWIFPTHPFSYASSIYDINKTQFVDLIVKTSRFDIEPYNDYTIQPYFQTSIPPPFFQTVDNLTIVSGGTGISYGISIFNYFKNKILNERKEMRLKLIWIVPTSADLYILNHLGIEGIDIYITGSKDRLDNKEQTTESSNPFLGANEEEIYLGGTSSGNGSAIGIGGDEDDEIFELESLNEFDRNDPFTDPFDDPNSNSKLEFKNKIYNIGKRPNLEELISRRLRLTSDDSNKWLISCGPKRMNSECEGIAKINKARYFVESYSM